MDLEISPEMMQLATFFSVIMGVFGAYLASKRGRSPVFWCLVGFAFSALGILVLALLPDISKKEPLTDDVELSLNPDTGSNVDVTIGASEPTVEVESWHYVDSDHEQHGPATIDELRVLWTDGEINEKSWVWCKGMEQWTRMESQLTLLAHFSEDSPEKV